MYRELRVDGETPSRKKKNVWFTWTTHHVKTSLFCVIFLSPAIHSSVPVRTKKDCDDNSNNKFLPSRFHPAVFRDLLWWDNRSCLHKPLKLKREFQTSVDTDPFNLPTGDRHESKLYELRQPQPFFGQPVRLTSRPSCVWLECEFPVASYRIWVHVCLSRYAAIPSSSSRTEQNQPLHERCLEWICCVLCFAGWRRG